MSRVVKWFVAAAAAAVWAIGVVPAYAQLNTQHLKGAAGLKSGSQPPPHLYAVLPIYYLYNTDTVKDRDGNTLPINVDISSAAFGAGFVKVTTKKIFGGSYGFQVLFPVGANDRIQGTEIDQNPGAGLTDSVVQPVQLGWHLGPSSKFEVRNSKLGNLAAP